MTNEELLGIIRNLEDVRLNKSYRKAYIVRLKEDIRMARNRNRAGIRSFTKAYVKKLESELKNLDKRRPFVRKIKVEIEE